MEKDYSAIDHIFDNYVETDADVLDQLQEFTEGTNIKIPDDPKERRKLLKKLWRNPPAYPEAKGGPDVKDNFFGIKLNRLKESRMKMMNRMAALAAKADGVKVYLQADGNPTLRNAVVGLELDNAIIQDESAQAFKELIRMGDDFTCFYRNGKVLFAIGLYDVWDEWREATEEELERYDPFPDRD